MLRTTSFVALSATVFTFLYETRVRRTPIATLERKDSSQFAICLSSLNGAAIPIARITHHRLSDTYPNQKDTGVIVYNAFSFTKLTVRAAPVPVCEAALKHATASFVPEDRFRQAADDVRATTTVTWWNEWGTKKETTFAWAVMPGQSENKNKTSVN